MKAASAAHPRQIKAALGAAMAGTLYGASAGRCPGCRDIISDYILQHHIRGWPIHRKARAEGLRAPPLLQPALRITRASLQRYALPLAAPLTSGPSPTPDPSGEPPAAWRTGLLLRVRVAAPGGREACGIGEIAPLPGAAPAVHHSMLLLDSCV